MSVSHRYEHPDRFVAGTVGEPGDRTFFLQARQDNRMTSVTCEKRQVSVLAESLERILEAVATGLSGATSDIPPRQERARDTGPLDAPIEEEFRIGTVTIAWDPDAERITIEMFAIADTADPDTLDQVPDVFVVQITPAEAREFVARAEALVAAGRPACPFCAQPIEPDGHICPRANGYRRPLW